jgi:hypothetical protein
LHAHATPDDPSGHPCTYRCVIEGKRRIPLIGGSCVLSDAQKAPEPNALINTRARGEPPNWESIPPEMPNWHSRVVTETGARGEPPNWGSILPKCPIGTPEWSRRREREENPPIGDPSFQNAQLALPSGRGDGSERRTPQSGIHPPKMPNWHS